jgi:hypothetical protein
MRLVGDGLVGESRRGKGREQQQNRGQTHAGLQIFGRTLFEAGTTLNVIFSRRPC